MRRGALIPSVSGSMLGGQIGVIQFATWNVAISRCRSCRTYPHSTTGVTVMVTPSGLKEIFEQRTALLLRISVWKSGISSRTHGHVPVEAKTAGGRRDGLLERQLEAVKHLEPQLLPHSVTSRKRGIPAMCPAVRVCSAQSTRTLAMEA